MANLPKTRGNLNRFHTFAANLLPIGQALNSFLAFLLKSISAHVKNGVLLFKHLYFPSIQGPGKNKLSNMAPDLVPFSRRITGSVLEYSAGCSTKKTRQKTSQSIKSDCLIYFFPRPSVYAKFQISYRASGIKITQHLLQLSMYLVCVEILVPKS